MKNAYFCFLLCVLSFVSNAQTLRFEENKGQWDTNVFFKARLQKGALFVENNGVVFYLNDVEKHQTKKTNSAHAFKIELKNALPSQIKANYPLPSYTNYFIGKDQSKWAEKVIAYQEVIYQNVFNNIDWKIYSLNQQVKHEFIIKPNGKVEDIVLEYKGLDNIKLKGEELILKTCLGEIIESKPYAYQVIEGKETQIKVNFSLNKNTLSYKIENYDKTLPLIIDPALIFSTYSGSTADNWGFTSTYDAYGNLYAGSIVDGIGYPTTLGAFVDTYAAGWDCTISKFSQDGSQLLFSTYYGGDQSEMPHSMIVNQYDELVVMGTTGSYNFPTTPYAFSEMFSAGSTITYDGTVSFPFGVDIYVSRFSNDGTALLASTYVGGTNNDGLNYREIYNANQYIAYFGNDSLYANYGDGARGELITDDQNNVYVGTTTFSSNFPVTPNAFQTTFGGNQEGVVFKLDYALSTMIFSSFIGGSGDDAVFSIDVDTSYNLYVTGGTISENFPVTTNAYDTIFDGGATDGFLALVSYDGSNLLTSTYFGSNKFDLSYFVRCDRNGYPHIFGQTKAEGSDLIYNATYNIPNSGQFLAKFNPDLNSLVWSTVFGTGDNQINISPTSFAVDVCGRVYAAGWGRLFKYVVPNNVNIFGTTNMQVTNDAYQSTTDGQDFYILSLSHDASVLEYATFFGELSNSDTYGNDHVDGGTSRYDKYSNLYQVVCASCSSSQDFPITPNAWSDSNQSSNCNMAAYKFQIHDDFAVADFVAPSYVCFPDTVSFTNIGRGDSFLWDFGDGTLSSLPSPSHVYQQAGTYQVRLIAYKNYGCIAADTITKQIILLDSSIDTLPTLQACNGDLLQIGIQPYSQDSVSFLWIPSEGLTNPNAPNPYALVSESKTYRLVISTPQCNDTLVQQIEVSPINSIDLITQDVSCPQENDGYALINTEFSNLITSYSWSNGQTGIDSIGGLSTGTYSVMIEDVFGCQIQDTFSISTLSQLNINITIDTNVCKNTCNGKIHIEPLNGVEPYSITWQDYALSGFDLENLCDGEYIFSVQDAQGCQITDTIILESKYNITTSTTQTLNNCQQGCGASASVIASGGLEPYSYLWSNSETNSSIEDLCCGVYYVDITDANQCTAKDTVEITYVDNLSEIEITASHTRVFDGKEIILSTNYIPGMYYYWTPSENLSSPLSYTTNATVYESGYFFVTVSDNHGCQVKDSIWIEVDVVECERPNIYVPNVFTPNNDGKNDIVFVKGEWIESFEFEIFDRWGESVFFTNNLSEGWDGTFNGKLCDAAVYFYRLVVNCAGGKKFVEGGDITLIR
ncbi:MAG: gliding motility-associated C-terminal domain-containing protein [Bacteroidales bacterium]|nr:gliding motility-associated C-terminal domain-containing protein [Bacteroidales bacterium]